MKTCEWNVTSFLTHGKAEEWLTSFDDNPVSKVYAAPGPRLVSQMVPHYFHCFLIVLMMMQRYITVCHPAIAGTIFKNMRHFAYAIISYILLLLHGLIIYAYMDYFQYDSERIKNEPPQRNFNYWTVENHLTLLENFR